MIAAARLFVLVLTVACGACTATRTAYDVSETYSPPESQLVPQTAEFEVTDFDIAWEGIVKFFATSQIPIATLEKESGIIVARRSIADSSASALVRAGSIHSKIQPVEETLEPSQFVGSGNVNMVRSTGKVTKRSPIGEPRTTTRTAQYKVSVAFNVMVERYGEQRLKVTINTAFDPEEDLRLFNGWFWPGNGDLPNSSATGILAAFMVMAPTAYQLQTPAPTSSGFFERSFLDHVASEVASKTPANKTGS